MLAGSAYFTVFALIPTLTFLAATSKQLGSPDLPREFKSFAIVLLPVLNCSKECSAYFIALREYHLAAGKTKVELYLVQILVIEAVAFWIVSLGPLSAKQ